MHQSWSSAAGNIQQAYRALGPFFIKTYMPITAPCIDHGADTEILSHTPQHN